MVGLVGLGWLVGLVGLVCYDLRPYSNTDWQCEGFGLVVRLIL